MKAIAFANRLMRDLKEKSLPDLTADARQEMLDAINGSIQILDSVAPAHSKITTGSIPLSPPETIEIGVTTDSTEVTGIQFIESQFYRTIRIDGDDIDNQIISATELLHPYAGETGTVSATIYCDAVSIPEPYSELVGDPRILDTDTLLVNSSQQCSQRKKQTCRPRFYHVEANARNRNPSAPSVIRFDSFPDKRYRIQSQFIMAPARITFADMLSKGEDIPFRAEHVESHLLPIARGILTSSSLWRDKETKKEARDASTAALISYESLVNQTLSTPRNFIGTKPGW